MQDLKVFINPPLATVEDNNGVGQVIHAQHRHLPSFGINLVGAPEDADVVVSHITGEGLPRVDVLQVHGLYWSGDRESGIYTSWHHEANARIIAAARRAHTITVPSAWVAECFKRDMRISPEIIGHGIDLDQWSPLENQGYTLWNKNRAADVCDPRPAFDLARSGAPVVTTFTPIHALRPDSLQVVGVVSHAVMRDMVRHAGFYLATTKETFGIGTIEALAAGVPVLGFDWGGTASLIQHKINGYLVKPGDVAGLVAGLAWLKENRESVSIAAQLSASKYDWKIIIGQYADLYRRVAAQKAQEPQGTSIVVTNYNYAAYLDECITSILGQTVLPTEIVLVDDGSTDNSLAIMQASRNESRVKIIAQANQGVAAARNNGIAAATQPYVICLDADDKLDPRYVEVMQKAMDADHGLGVAYSGLGIIQQNGTVNLNAWPVEFSWSMQSSVGNPPRNCIPCAAMFRRSMWERAGGYKQVYAPGEDTEFFTRGLSVGFTAQQVSKEPLFHYRQHEGSASRTKQYRPIDSWHPWMRDRQFPMAAPAEGNPIIRSYSDPVVSVVIPVGPGHAKLLPGSVDSVLGQTFRSWELIIVDDTGDPMVDVLRPYPFARVVTTDGATGPAHARNLGLAKATAPLVVFLDADDFLLPEALDKMLRLYIDSGGKYVYTDWYAINGDKTNHDKAPEYNQAAWLQHGQHAITALFPTDKARAIGFDESMQGWEDWRFFIEAAIQGVCGVRLPEPLLGYRQHTGSVREKSFANKDKLLGVLRDSYAAYAIGDKQMSACCGGNADALIKARKAIDEANGISDIANPVQPENQPIVGEEPPVLRMEFIGEQRGAVSYIGKPSGKNYRGGNNPYDRYVDADPRDVDFLQSTGVWRLTAQVPRSIVPSKIIAPAAPEQIIADIKTAQHLSTPVRPLIEEEPLSPEMEAVLNRQAASQAKQQRQASR